MGKSPGYQDRGNHRDDGNNNCVTQLGRNAVEVPKICLNMAWIAPFHASAAISPNAPVIRAAIIVYTSTFREFYSL